MRRDTKIQIVALALMAFFMVTSGVLAVQITGSSGRHKLIYSVKAEEGDPPQVALGIAMGAFRGIFVNFLWIRANELKEQGRYYEAIDLASTITKLQPRFPRVWSFHAWNMSYNISVSTQTQAERWSWVRAGVELLRDEGIPANPNEMLLHKELAWIYLHKIAGWTDDANQYYKAQHAGEWTILLGPPPRYSTDTRASRDAAIAMYADWLRTIADAPSTLEEVVEIEPSVGTLVNRLRGEVDLQLDYDLLMRYERQRAVIERDGSRLVGSVRYSERGQRFKEIFEDASLQDAWAALLPHVRKRVLTDVYHMEPERMIRYTEQYGPIDWRWPSAHALYWGARGVERGLIRKYEGNARDFDFLNTDRIVLQSIQDLYRYSDLYFDFYTWATQPQSTTVTVVGRPNIHFVPAYQETVIAMEARNIAIGGTGGLIENPKERVFRHLGLGFENFMKDFIRQYYRAGFVEEAEKLKDELAVWPGSNANDWSRVDRFAKPIDEFIREDLKDRMNSPNVANSEIDGALRAAYNFGLLAGDMERFRAEFEYANTVHQIYMREQYRPTLASGGDITRMEMVARDFRFFAAIIFSLFLQELPPEDAQIVYERAPEDLKRWGYDILQDLFRQSLDSNEDTPSFDEAFPEPAGMAEFRLERQKIIEDEERPVGPQGIESR